MKLLCNLYNRNNLSSWQEQSQQPDKYNPLWNVRDNCVFLFLVTHFLVKVEVFSEDYVLLLCVPTVDVVVLGGDV